MKYSILWITSFDILSHVVHYVKMFILVVGYHGIPIKYKGLLYPTSGKILSLMVKKREHEGQWPIFRSEELFKD